MADSNDGALPVLGYEVPDERGDGRCLAYTEWFHKYGHPLPESAIPLTDHATASALIEDLRRQLAEKEADAQRYRWVHQFLSIDDAGDDSAAYGLFVDKEGMEEAAWRVKMWRSFDHLGEDPTPDDAIDAARSAGGAGGDS